MDIKLLEEPLLQFGKGEYICPRTGIYKYNVSDINDIRPDKIVIGFIGLSESINIAISWIKKCRNHIESKKSKQPNLFTNFPGFNETIAFRSEVVYDESYIRKINNSALDQIKREANDIDQLIIKTVDLYLAEIHFLANNKKPDVILCVLDESLTKIIYGTKTIEIDDDFNEEDDCYEITTAPDDFGTVSDALSNEGVTFASAEVTMIPQTMVELTSEDDIKKMNRILDLLDEDDDVQNVYHNWDE